MRFNPPPGWPQPPEGWVPPAGWSPDPSWPAPPEGWQLWVPEDGNAAGAAGADGTEDRAEEADSPAQAYRDPLFDPLPPVGEQAPAAEAGTPTTAAAAVPAAATPSPDPVAAPAPGPVATPVSASPGTPPTTAGDAALLARIRELEHALAVAQSGADDADVVELSDQRVLQEVGIYRYHHPLENVEAYRNGLKTSSKNRSKTLVKSGDAILASDMFTFNNSLARGRKMTSDFSKLMLRAYNAEADNLVRALSTVLLEICY